MLNKRILPDIPTSASELLDRIDESRQLELEDFEDQIPQAIGSYLNWMFSYVERFYPECIKPTGTFATPTIELVELADGPKGYKAGSSPYYRIGKYMFGDSDQPNTRFIISQIEPTSSQGESTTPIFNREFSADNGEMLGAEDNVIAGSIYEILTRPDLYLKVHLDESWFAKKLRMLKSRKLGGIAVKSAKLP